MRLGPLMLDLEAAQLQSDEVELVKSPHVGGVILFSRNFESIPQLLGLIREIRDYRPELLLAVDQEGGRVQRFKEGFTRLPPMQTFYQGYCQFPEDTLLFVEDCGWLMAAELLACELDFSFAPVLDLDAEHCKVIADRAFADDPVAVSALAGAFIRGMHDAGMAATGKHFPGHGSVSGDSHMLLPIDTRSMEEIQVRDMQPFSNLSDELDGIMPAHIQFLKIDQQPVGFSRIWLQEMLRKKLNFKGVIFSDDLSMEGATGAGSYAERASLALSAGCDMVLACNNRIGALDILQWLEKTDYEPSPRLSTMSRRKQWCWDAVRQSRRWQRTAEQLAGLVGG